MRHNTAEESSGNVSSQKENISNMFRSIEVWIAAHKNGHHYKKIEETQDTPEETDNEEKNELSWEITLRPKNKIQIRDSLWV